MLINLQRHARFLFAFALGFGVAALGSVWLISRPVQALVGVNGFFVAYLGLTARLALSTSPAALKRHAETDDEGIVLIVLLATGAVLVSLTATLWVLNREDTSLWQAVLALSAVPLGWATVHTLVAFHYAHLFYSAKAGGGLTFPETKQPGVLDFLYLSFGIGMTAQVADVIVTQPRIRRMVLVHAIASFFYNAVILALAVNAGIALGS